MLKPSQLYVELKRDIPGLIGLSVTDMRRTPLCSTTDKPNLNTTDKPVVIEKSTEKPSKDNDTMSNKPIDWSMYDKLCSDGPSFMVSFYINVEPETSNYQTRTANGLSELTSSSSLLLDKKPFLAQKLLVNGFECKYFFCMLFLTL